MMLYVKISQMFYPMETFNGDECCSCLQAMTDANKTLFDPCGHGMCNTCADQWAGVCPLCRRVINHRLLQTKRSVPEGVSEDAPAECRRIKPKP